MAFYIVMCFFGMSSLCYVVARDVKILFLLEKSEGERGDQLSGLLDLFDGGVLIIDEKSHEVVYQNNQLTVRQFDLFDQVVSTEAVFRILPRFNVMEQKKDAVRLYENPQNEYQSEIPEEASYVSLTDVLKNCF